MRKTLYLFFFLALGVVLMSSHTRLAGASELLQQPTVSIPTWTGTSRGIIVRVSMEQDQINARSWPGLDYPSVGLLIGNQELTALGRSPGGDWIQIAYPGVPSGIAWVYSFLVSVPTGTLPIVVPPPTPTPLTTPTIDPTLAGQFNLIATPTRLPTYTPPPPIIYVTYQPPGGGLTETIPVGMVIIGLAAVGFLGVVLSFLRNR